MAAEYSAAVLCTVYFPSLGIPCSSTLVELVVQDTHATVQQLCQSLSKHLQLLAGTIAVVVSVTELRWQGSSCDPANCLDLYCTGTTWPTALHISSQAGNSAPVFCHCPGICSLYIVRAVHFRQHWQRCRPVRVECSFALHHSCRAAPQAGSSGPPGDYNDVVYCSTRRCLGSAAHISLQPGLV